jgi:hypothetical protein
MVDFGGSSPGQIQTIPSCSKQGNDWMRTLSIFVDGIFSHFPFVEYSHPEVMKKCNVLLSHKICLAGSAHNS